MREITEHKINPANDVVSIYVTDNIGAGGENHRYELYGINYATNISGSSSPDSPQKIPDALILFQNGPIPKKGTNGVTHEMLLAIVADRLRSFQDGPFKCKANACALTHIEEAQHWLQQRTIERMRRNVEGTHTV